MQLKKLGNSDLEITPVGLGTWAIGGEGRFGWGPQEDKDSIRAIHEAVERGINWIDTAPIYGQGRSEKVVAKAVKEIGGDMKPYIFTKCSLVWDDEGNVSHVLKADSIKREVDESLRRLNVDTLDLCQIHWASGPTGDTEGTIEEAWKALADAKEKGKIRYIAVSNFDVDEMKRIQKIAPITSLQPPYSMLMRQIEDDILPFCKENNIGVLVYSPMHNGLLTGKYDREKIEKLPHSDWRKENNTAFKEPMLSRSLEVVDLLREIARRHSREVPEVSVAWTLRHPAVTAAIVGARRPDQVKGFIGAMDFRLSDDEIAEIDEKLPEPIGMFG